MFMAPVYINAHNKLAIGPCLIRALYGISLCQLRKHGCTHSRGRQLRHPFSKIVNNTASSLILFKIY